MTVTIDDVAVLLGRDLTGEEEDRAVRLVEIAESAVESALPGFSFAVGSETVGVMWHDPAVIWTPRYPVTAVNAITFDGVAGDPAGMRFDPKGRIELVSAGVLIVNQTSFVAAGGWTVVTVDYDYGLDPTPPVLAGVVASMVATSLRRQDINPGNVASETIGDYSVTYGVAEQAANAAGMVIPCLPARWKRTTAVSVPMTRYR